MSEWVNTTIKAVRLPSGAWVRTDRVDAVEERHGTVYAILSCGEHVRAGTTDAGVTATKVIKTIWGATDD